MVLYKTLPQLYASHVLFPAASNTITNVSENMFADVILVFEIFIKRVVLMYLGPLGKLVSDPDF